MAIFALVAVLVGAAAFQLSNNKVEKVAKAPVINTNSKTADSLIAHSRRKEERIKLSGSSAAMEGEEESEHDIAERVSLS